MQQTEMMDIDLQQQEQQKDDFVPEEEIPTKCIAETVELNVKSKIYFIDYEGRSDGESIKKILANIKPKNLIIVHGSEKSTIEMQEYCQKQQIVQNRIFMPRINEVVNATLETQIYNVKLKDELVSSLKFHKVKDYELAWVDAVIKYSDTAAPVDSGSSGAAEFSLNLHPLSKESIKEHKTVFVNEPKLSDLKQILIQNSIQAEFHGGVLVCNGIIALKKNQAGRIVLEGVVSDDYYKVRKILYEQYAQL
jgi:cleavage and polyadenylation specificity factor subunit 2